MKEGKEKEEKEMEEMEEGGEGGEKSCEPSVKRQHFSLRKY